MPVPKKQILGVQGSYMHKTYRINPLFVGIRRHIVKDDCIAWLHQFAGSFVQEAFPLLPGNQCLVQLCKYEKH